VAFYLYCRHCLRTTKSSMGGWCGNCGREREDFCSDCFNTGRRVSDGQPCQSCDRAKKNPALKR
jgi:hypothetical protein